jgi:hypothetical protein
VARRKNQVARDIRRGLRERVIAAVAEVFPGCEADFCGGVERSRMAVLGVTLGFRVREADGKYRSNIIWLNPRYTGLVSAEWVERAVAKSNGR